MYDLPGDLTDISLNQRHWWVTAVPAASSTGLNDGEFDLARRRLLGIGVVTTAAT